MGHKLCFEFGRKNLKESDIRDKHVIDVGASPCGGSMRPFVESFHPKKYIGADLKMGPGIDEVCDAYNLLRRFGKDSFDIVITNELLEHIQHWQRVIHIFKTILRPNGIMIITTRSKGFPFHASPFDFWRYELSDMKTIFADFIIEALENDARFPGVFIKVRKPADFKELDLRDYKLYSIIKNRRVKKVNNFNICWYKIRYLVGKREM